MAANDTVDPQALAQRFRIKPGSAVELLNYGPSDVSALPDEVATKSATTALAKEIDVLQDRLYAEGTRSLLVILQGTDTSGKDGTIRSVFSATGALGVSVKAFKPPTVDEAAHDFLWRAHCACPTRGTIGIFNRSYYEDVLVVKVRGLAPKDAIERRYEQINDFEKMLTENGTTVLKSMLHLSKKEQAKRLKSRLDDPTKHWKFSPGDLADRALWDEFQSAYHIMLERCSTAWAPWHVVPADRKWARNAVVAATVQAALSNMNPQYPQANWKPGEFTIT